MAKILPQKAVAQSVTPSGQGVPRAALVAGAVAVVLLLLFLGWKAFAPAGDSVDAATIKAHMDAKAAKGM